MFIADEMQQSPQLFEEEKLTIKFCAIFSRLYSKVDMNRNQNSDSGTVYWVTCQYCRNEMVSFALEGHISRNHIAVKCSFCNNWMPRKAMERHVQRKHSGLFGRNLSPMQELSRLMAILCNEVGTKTE